jgi:hypothetical protein
MTNPRNFAHPRRDSALVAVAGPISNILQVPFWLAATFVIGFIGAKMGVTGMDNASVMGPNDASAVSGRSGQHRPRGVQHDSDSAARRHWILQAIGGRPIEELFDMIRPYAFILLILVLNFTPLFSIALRPAYQLAGNLASSALFAGVQLGAG